MASELKVDKFTGVTTAGSIDVTGEGNSTTTNLQQGLVKNWQHHTNGTTLEDSFNQSTLTDNGTGDYTMTFTNSMANTDYITVFHQRPHDNTSGSHNQITGTRLDTLLSTGSYDQHHGQVSDGNIGSHTDGQTGGAVLGDLA